MKNLKVLFIDTDTNEYWNETNFEYGCRLNNIKPQHITIYEMPEFDFSGVDCIVYGFILYRTKRYLSMLPASKPKIIWTTTPDNFEGSTDPIVDRFTPDEAISTLPYYFHRISPTVVSILNKIRTVCEPVKK